MLIYLTKLQVAGFSPTGATGMHGMYAKRSNSMSQLTSLEYVFSEDVVVAAVSNIGLATKICAKKVQINETRKLFWGG